MIPLHLRISGFLSYHDLVELDFTPFDLACISGHNGAGKSSLLDAITWSLFGEARGKSSDVINLRQDVKAAEVALTFQHEDNVYRVQRTLPRNKNTLLEFQVRTQTGWKPLTEKTTRETQARIEQTLRLKLKRSSMRLLLQEGRSVHATKCRQAQGSAEQYPGARNVGGIQE
jgi:exonuclease SbcC